MAYEFPGYKGNCCDDSEALRAVLAVLEKYEALESRVSSLEGTTTRYPEQWANAVSNSERITRNMITQHDEELREMITQHDEELRKMISDGDSSTLTAANAFTTQQIAFITNRMGNDITSLDLRLSALVDQYGQLAGDYHANKVIVKALLDGLRQDVNKLNDDLADGLISAEEARKVLEDEIKTLKTAVDGLADKMLQNVNTLINPYSGEAGTVQEVVNAIFESNRTATTMTVAQVEASRITAGDVQNAMMTGGEISGGGILLKPKDINNPITGLRRSLNNALSFIPDTKREWPNTDIQGEWGELKEKDMTFNDWRKNGKYFPNKGWFLKEQSDTIFNVYKVVRFNYEEGDHGSFKVASEYEPDYLEIYATTISGDVKAIQIDWSWDGNFVHFDVGVHAYSKIDSHIYASVERSDFNES